MTINNSLFVQLPKKKKETEVVKRSNATTVAPQEVRIDVSNFNYTKKEPLVFEGWNIYRERNFIIATTISRKPNKYHTKFTLENGYLYVVNNPKYRYAYFRSDEFIMYRDKFNIQKVVGKDPNGYYFGRNSRKFNTVSTFNFVTDGEFVILQELPSGVDHPLYNASNADTFIHIKDASFVLVREFSYREDKSDIEPFERNILFSKHSIKELESEMSQAIEALRSHSKS